MKARSLDLIHDYVSMANYLSVAQIFLQNNFLLDKKLSFDDIKPRLLGHWGTCPGINFVYAQLNYLIKKNNLDMLFVLGPGHGFPALQANLFLENTLSKFYPQAQLNESGIEYLCKNFSWPYGFPSHTNPGTPGAILEGGELGYALSTSYGAALDHPNLIVACLIGDGEAETAATATSWHLNKLITNKNNGKVLPILHLNGYKISGPTIFGRMSKKELNYLFKGYGYEPIFVKEQDIYLNMAQALELSLDLFKADKHPVIILQTPKGWTGIKKLDGKKIEGNCLSHQVVLTKAKNDKHQLQLLEKWLKSYDFNNLFGKLKTNFFEEILPPQNLRMGVNKHAQGQLDLKLKISDESKFYKHIDSPGKVAYSSMLALGDYLAQIFKNNKNIRFFSPDEIYSNKLDAILKVTNREFNLPIKKWDQALAGYGAVIEMLSEHALQGLAQGYILTKRHAIFASYEAFIDIVSSMTAQLIKFLRVAREYKWRGNYSSLTYILTSSGWRQEHNGYSHQNPGFISAVLEKHYEEVKVYFPPDANVTLAVMNQALSNKNGINIIVAGKTDEFIWLNEQQSKLAIKENISIWEFASDDNPDLIFCAIGDYMCKEVLAAITILKEVLPNIRLRFVNILMLQGAGNKNRLYDQTKFEHYFTPHLPVIFNYWAYPETLQSILWEYSNPQRFKVNGYIERGSTTTPFDMLVRNGVSRYNLVIDAVKYLNKFNIINTIKAEEIVKTFEQKIVDFKDYIIKFGEDPKEITNWRWKNI